MESAATKLYSMECTNAMISKAYPVGILRAVDNNNSGVHDEVESRNEPYIGLEFDSADEAREFYTSYAMRVGFKTRTGQLYRSRSDGTVSSRRFVCSKEGFQLNSRSGCSAFIRVRRCDSGKWVLDQIQKDHNHDLGPGGEYSPPAQRRTLSLTESSISVSHKPKLKRLEAVNGPRPCVSGTISVKRLKQAGDEVQPTDEPYVGLEFDSATDACQFYQVYAESTGFRIRIGQLFRSKVDGSITSRRFVCSREGFQHPSRLGCGAYMRIKRQDSGGWIVDRLQNEHNHDLEMGNHEKVSTSSKKLIEDISGGLSSGDLIELNSDNHIERCRENKIGSDWYHVLLHYFQTKQAEDTGFFYSVEVDEGRCMSVFWADGRSRFSCSQFGDVIVLDTSYNRDNYSVPFATFVGVNHHKQPVLLGCALIADESKESFTWLFQTWLSAMSGHRPKSIIADQDAVIQHAIMQVFPGTRHRFSLWQIRAKEREHLRSIPSEFKYEYDKCIYHSQTNVEFNTVWNALITKYGLRDNTWLREMYEKRECWVPLYLRGTFFAGIPMNDAIESFFGTFLTALTPLREFISRYEQGLHHRREEERREDFNSFNLHAFLQTKEPVEEQCRSLYTLTLFKVFQNELVQSYNYLGIKTYEEGPICRLSVRKCGHENDKHVVTFNSSNLNVGCSCQMFEFEGVLCRHILKVLNLFDVREIPSRYILHRWTKNAESGFIRDMESGSNALELKAAMAWSLREAACKYIEFGTSSVEKFKLAYEIMREGEKKLNWQR